MNITTKRAAKLISVVLAPIFPIALLAGTAAADAWPYQATYSAVASGSTMTATESITATNPTPASNVSICATGADGTKYGFTKTNNVTLSTTPTVITVSRTLPVGTYSYGPCFTVNGSWTYAGGTKNIYVPGTPPPPDPRMPIDPVPGLTQTFTEDFTTPLAQGSWPGSYAAK